MITVNVRKKLPEIEIEADFKIENTGISVLFGESGAGKSSIINMLAGLMTPTEGVIEVGGVTLFDSYRKINVPPEKRGAGYVFQDSRLFPHMNVRKNLLYGAKKSAPADSVLSVAELLGIAHILDRFPENLSGGEKQRVAIGRALLSNPQMLLMDEPMASLDSSRKNELVQYISLLPERFNIPIIYVTHTMEEILRLADNVALMSKGKMELFGPTLEVLNHKRALSLLPDKDFGSVMEGRVISPGNEYGLGVVEFGGGHIDVAPGDIAANTRVRFKIPAQDVVLSREETYTVARNVFKGTIIDAVMHGHVADVLLDIDLLGSGHITPMWARITRQSYDEKHMKKGETMYATVKSVVASSQFHPVR